MIVSVVAIRFEIRSFGFLEIRVFDLERLCRIDSNSTRGRLGLEVRPSLLQAWKQAHSDVWDQAMDLRGKGVAAERLLTDTQELGLGDSGSTIKIVYTIADRAQLVGLLFLRIRPGLQHRARA